MQGERVRLAPQMAGNNRYRAEFSHGSGCTQNDPVKQRPLDMRKRNSAENREPIGSHQCRRLFLILSLRIHHREQLAEYKRKRDKYRGQNHSRHGKDNLNIVGFQKIPHPADVSEGQDKNQTGNDRRNGKRNINQGSQNLPPFEIKF